MEQIVLKYKAKVFWRLEKHSICSNHCISNDCHILIPIILFENLALIWPNNSTHKNYVEFIKIFMAFHL